MKIIYLSRSNSGAPHPFIKEQADCLIRNYNLDIEHFLIKRGGVIGYFKAIVALSKFITQNSVQIIHVHYGLWALVAVVSKYVCLRNCKIVVTYHGSDIFIKRQRRISLLGSHFVSQNILVSERMRKYFRSNVSVIPCGIDVDVDLLYRDATRVENGWDENDFIILFSSRFDRKVKDADFAFKVIAALSAAGNKLVKFIELKGYSREQLTRLMQAADVLLMCSISEGSPQVIKEAILNSLPVVSNDVGDVRSICSGADNCFILKKDTEEFVKTLKLISQTKPRVQNRKVLIDNFDNNKIADKIFNVYTRVLSFSDLYTPSFSLPLSFEEK